MERIVRAIHEVQPIHSVNFNIAHRMDSSDRSPHKRYTFSLEFPINDDGTVGKHFDRNIRRKLAGTFGKSYAEAGRGHVLIHLDRSTSKASPWLVGIHPETGIVTLHKSYILPGRLEQAKRAINGRLQLRRMAKIIAKS